MKGEEGSGERKGEENGMGGLGAIWGREGGNGFGYGVGACCWFMRYMAPSRKGLTGRGNGREGSVVPAENGGRAKGEEVGTVGEVLGNKEMFSVTGMNDLDAALTGWKPLGSFSSSLLATIGDSVRGGEAGSTCWCWSA